MPNAGRSFPFRTRGLAEFVASVEGEYPRFGKTPRLGEDLERVFQVDLAELNREWNGVKCVYRIAR